MVGKHIFDRINPKLRTIHWIRGGPFRRPNISLRDVPSPRHIVAELFVSETDGRPTIRRGTFRCRDISLKRPHRLDTMFMWETKPEQGEAQQDTTLRPAERLENFKTYLTLSSKPRGK